MTMTTLTPEELEKAAKKAYQDEALEDAVKHFEAALEGYKTRGDAIKTAETQNNLSVVYLQLDQHQKALDILGDSIEVFANHQDVRKQAMAVGNQAAALDALGKYQEAETKYLECAQLLKDIGDHELRSSVLQSISRLQMRTGRYLEAVASMQTGLDEVEKPSARQKLVKKLLNLPFKMMQRSGK